MRQIDKTFSPHVLAVPVGGTVAFVNDDQIHHNVFSLTSPNAFDSGLYKSGAAFHRTFTKPGPVELLCNIHANMAAYVYVVGSPHFSVTNRAGAFTLRRVPPGRYRIEAWHEGSLETRGQVLVVGPEGVTSVTLRLPGDRGERVATPDKYGRPRQAHLGY
jgi:hypothetical protein